MEIGRKRVNLTWNVRLPGLTLDVDSSIIVGFRVDYGIGRLKQRPHPKMNVLCCRWKDQTQSERAQQYPIEGCCKLDGRGLLETGSMKWVLFP